MEMNNLRVESHVAQKNRRHKLRFQHNSNDLNHQQQPPQDHHQSFSYSHNVFPSEMISSIARNPHLLLPQGHSYVSHDQDAYSGSGQPERVLMSSSGSQECNKWKSVASSHQEGANDHWNVVGYSNNVSMNSGSYSYHQDVQQPFYHSNVQQDHVTIAHPSARPCWMNNSNSDGSSFLANRIHDHQEQTTQQALSLSLSSVSQLKDDQPMLESGPKAIKSDLLPNSDPKSIMGVSAFAHRSVGPLGPFTGYATILKNSKYMKSAQELLNESCDVGYQEMVPTCLEFYTQKILEDEMSRASDYSGGSEDHISGRSSSGADSFRPEFQRKKAKLLYMQDEVCRRYKQYLQQMQMVISSFETVAGLSAATPYVCLALKAVSRHFHLVKNVISEQLSQMRKMVGEGLCSSTTTSSKAFDPNATSTSHLKSVDHRLGKYGGAAGYFSSQQPAWRPQRGLPERAISVLKTWLFDHFLHPYPSDADKHMLATQTGLTRNQVSNWFINARVRIWKPMVEEIHTLETKGLTEQNLTNPQSECQDPSRMDISSLSNTQPPECSRNTGVTLDGPNDQLRDHEKLARPEYQIPLSNMDRLMSIMPYPQATFDATRLGPVSLTLGLRQNAEHVQQLQQHFGGQLIHDFVG